MKKTWLLILLVASQLMEAQTTQDTINNPYWINMMGDRSINIKTTKRAYDLYFSNKLKAKGTGYKQFERWYHHWKLKVNEDGSFPAPDRTMQEMKKYFRNNLTPRSAAGSWTSMGPSFNATLTYSGSFPHAGVGRVNAVAFHNSNPNIIYAGAPQGGFWYTTDKGSNWSTSTDNLTFQSLGVSDIVFIPGSPDSVILIATGDRDANDADGIGVWRSTNGGQSFTNSSTGIGTQKVNMFALNPEKNSTIFAAADNGIYVSYNSGLNWTQRSSVTGFKDIKYCPGDTMTIYATRSGDFYRSTNAGTTWSMITSGFNTTARNRLAIGVTAANPNIVYIVASATTNKLEAFYKSSNKGANFSQRINGTAFNILGGDIDGQDSRGQGWYDLCIIGSPADSNFVLVGGINIFKSLNGGSSWTPSASWKSEGGTDYVHADIHYFSRNPLNSEIWVGSDGGVDFTSNNGTSYTSRNNGLTIGQIYNLGVSQRSKTRFISGFQDDGTKVGSTSTNWIARVGGDGMQCEISNFDTTVLFGNVQYGDLRRSTNNGVTWVDMPVPNQPGPWAAPCHLHPRINDIMVVLYKNAVVSKDIVTAGVPSFTNITTGETTDGSAIRFSNVNDSIVFLGWEDGVFRQANILASPITVTTMTNPNGGNRISDIETSFNNENVVYCTSGNRVYKSTNRGSTWTNISANLPNIPMFSIVLDKNSPEGLYVGTDAGLWYKDSLMTNWVFYNSGMAVGSQIRDLEIVYDTVCSDRSVIYAATYGRGLWKGDLRISETQPNPNFTIPATSCVTLPVQITNTTTSITNNGAATSYEWIITPNTFTYSGATNSNSPNPIVTFNAVGSYTITLKARKPYGGFCTITKNNIITINNNGNLTLKTTNDTTICPGDSVLVSLGGMQNYSFTPTTNVAKFNDSFAFVNPIANTNYMIIGDINGSCLDTAYVNVKMKASPNYVISGSTSFCNGDSTIISISNVDTAFWSPGSGVIDITPTSKKIKLTASNIYNLRLVKSGLCDVKLGLPILVKTIPNFSLSKSFNQSLCVGDSSLVIESNSVPSLSWSPNSNITNLGFNSFRFKPINTTAYYLSTTDTNYCVSKKDSIKFTMTPKPVLTINGLNKVCGGATAILTASGADTFKWTASTGTVIPNIGSSVSATPVTNTTYTILGITGPCTTTAFKNINVGLIPVNMTFTGKTEVCKGAGIDLNVFGADTVRWYPSKLVSNEFGKSVRISTDTSTNIKVIGETTGCFDTLDIPLTIRPLPLILATKSQLSPICPGEKVSIKSTGGASYSIYPLYNTVKPKFDSFVVAPNVTTKYFVYGKSSFGCEGLDSLIIDVSPNPIVTINPTLTTIKKGDSFQITAAGGNQYDWTPNKYIKGNNQQSAIIVKPDSNIVYTVQVTNAQGCKTKGISIVYVQHNPNPPSGIISPTFANILIYPNPAQNEINVEGSEVLKVSIYSMNGAIVKDSDQYALNHKINLEDLASGTYFLSIETILGQKKINKIEINK
jgi:hypothetical protein